MKRSHLFIIPFFLLFFAFYSGSFAAGPGERDFYSVHLASFKNLLNANNFVSSLKNKGNAVFWKKADVPGKGLFYRVYPLLQKEPRKIERMDLRYTNGFAVRWQGSSKDETVPVTGLRSGAYAQDDRGLT